MRPTGRAAAERGGCARSVRVKAASDYYNQVTIVLRDIGMQLFMVLRATAERGRCARSVRVMKDTELEKR